MAFRNNCSIWRVIVVVFLFQTFFIITAPNGAASQDLKLVINGELVESKPSPIIKNGRTLVPIRLVSEKLGALVEWRGESETVLITKNGETIKLKIGNRLIKHSESRLSYGLTDVPPQIFDSRTFVPIRQVSDAFGISVEWDGKSRTVYIDSSKPSEYIPQNLNISSTAPGQVIKGTTHLKVNFNGNPPREAAQVRFLLLDPETFKGPIVVKGSDIKGTYRWIPDPYYNGKRILAAALYDKEGNYLDGDVVPVKVAVEPKVSLKGLQQGQTIQTSAVLSSELNFVAEYVKYKITNTETGREIITGEADPQGSYNWTPQLGDNGETTIQAIAYRLGQAYYSPSVKVKVNVNRKLQLRGVSAGATISKPVTLWISRNFPITKVEYVLKNMHTKQEKVLYKTEGYSSYKWFPGPDYEGSWQLFARVKDTEDKTFETNTIDVKISGDPKIIINAVGPNQVLTGSVKLKALSNVDLKSIKYQLINPKTNKRHTIVSGNDAEAEYEWKPVDELAGPWKLQAVGAMASGREVTSEAIPVKVYTGKTYGPTPIIEKSRFLDFVSKLAVESQEKTSMSAALQAAQAILETGWGQYTPTDKYTGKPSNNLFGIKGRGTKGSVISNTWEEYSGNIYRVDAAFRAYHNPAESWKDHKALLLNASRYKPYREVMHNSIQGAWALRRAGYATDSKYPLKLINIIKHYKLYLLDEMDI